MKFSLLAAIKNIFPHMHIQLFFSKGPCIRKLCIVIGNLLAFQTEVVVEYWVEMNSYLIPKE